MVVVVYDVVYFVTFLLPNAIVNAINKSDFLVYTMFFVSDYSELPGETQTTFRLQWTVTGHSVQPFHGLGKTVNTGKPI